MKQNLRSMSRATINEHERYHKWIGSVNLFEGRIHLVLLGLIGTDCEGY